MTSWHKTSDARIKKRLLCDVDSSTGAGFFYHPVQIAKWPNVWRTHCNSIFLPSIVYLCFILRNVACRDTMPFFSDAMPFSWTPCPFFRTPCSFTSEKIWRHVTFRVFGFRSSFSIHFFWWKGDKHIILRWLHVISWGRHLSLPRDSRAYRKSLFVSAKYFIRTLWNLPAANL